MLKELVDQKREEKLYQEMLKQLWIQLSQQFWQEPPKQDKNRRVWWLSGRKQRSDSNVQDIDTKTIVGDGLNNVLSPTEQRELNKAFKQAYKEETRILEKKAEDVMYSLNAFNPHLTSITTQITPLENKPTTLILALANGSERTVIQLRCYDSEAVRLLQERLEQEEVIWIKGCNPGSFYLISFISPSQPTIPLLLSGKHLVQL